MDLAIDAIYAAAVDASRWSSAAEHISALFGERPVLLIVDDTRAGKMALKASVGIDDAAWAMAEAHYSTLDTNPTLPIAMTIALDRAVDQAAMVGDAAFRRSAVFADVYKPQGQWPFLGTVAARSQSVFGGMAVMRGINGAPADRAQFQLAERLSTHIGRALSLSNVFNLAAQPAINFQEALHCINDAVLIIDAGCKIAWTNEAAERLVAETNLLNVTGKILAFKQPPYQHQLAKAMKLAGQGIVATARMMGSAGESFVLRIQRLSSSQSVGAADLLVTIKAARSRTRFVSKEAAALFGLTMAEAKVACELCATPGIGATAETLGLSVNTVKSLLRRCFEKIGVHSQSELTLLFATSLRSHQDLEVRSPDSGTALGQTNQFPLRRD